MTNTEKPTTRAEQKKQGAVVTPKQKIVNAPQKPKEKKSEKIENESKETLPDKETKSSIEKKPEVKKKKGSKKSEAIVNSFSLPISTKISRAICKFIKGKNIENALQDLEQVIKGKKAVPMKGEIPHKKGKGMMSGRYPQKAAKHFITLLKTLRGNSNVNELDEPIICEAIANMASRPYGRFGSIKKKRTHISIKAKEKKLISKKK